MKSVLVIGMGEFGKHLAEKMQDLGNDVMIVDEDDEIVEQLSEKFTDSFVGDCTNVSVINSLGINNFDICFVTIGSNFQSSLVITSLLKKHGAKFIVAKAKQEIQKQLLYTIGANEVIYPERDIAERLAVRYNTDNIFDYIELNDNYAIFEIPALHSWTGYSIKDIDVRKKHNINIMAIKQKDGSLVPAPGATYVFTDGDHIVVVGRAADVFKLSGKVK